MGKPGQAGGEKFTKMVSDSQMGQRAGNSYIIEVSGKQVRMQRKVRVNLKGGFE